MVVGIIFIIIAILDILVVSDILRGNLRDDTARILWLLTVILLPVVGLIFYFTASKDYKIQK